MAGGGGQNLGTSMMRMGSRLGGILPSQSPVPSYVSPSALSKGPAGPSNISPMPTMQDNFAQPAAFQLSPLAQQMMQRAQPPMVGLPAALMQMQGQLNQPIMRNPMPIYRSQALDYRPDMTSARQALNRVRPSVYKTDLDAARARIAELEAAQQSVNDPYYGSYSSGGG